MLVVTIYFETTAIPGKASPYQAYQHDVAFCRIADQPKSAEFVMGDMGLGLNHVQGMCLMQKDK